MRFQIVAFKPLSQGVRPCCKGPPLLQGFMISNEIPDCCFQTLVSSSSPLLQGSTLVARVHPCCKGPPSRLLLSNPCLKGKPSCKAFCCPNLLPSVHPCCKGSFLVFCTLPLLARASCQLSCVPCCKGCFPYYKGLSFTCWTFSKGLWKKLCWPSA